MQVCALGHAAVSLVPESIVHYSLGMQVSHCIPTPRILYGIILKFIDRMTECLDEL
jgi:hypothetical protein